jgi:TolB-like protein/Tfp pilus assembly protein PilF
VLVVLGALWLHGARGVERSWAGGPGAGSASGIAVLPFLNLSPDPEQEYFADGVTEDLLTYISRIEGLRVISRTSVMRYKGSEAPLREIARELGVVYILEGSVRRDGNQVRVSAQLIEAATDDHLWAQNYDREIAGIFTLQSEIAQEIADALRRRLPSDERARMAAGGTASMAAYDLVLRGREYLNRPGDADLRKFPPAVAFFRRALDADPGYARALVSLSEAFQRNVGLLTQVRADSAIAYAHRAVAADSLLAAAHAALGAAYLLGGSRVEAEGALRRALELDPNQADALSGMATLAALGGRLDRAAAWQIQAVAVDPWAPPRLVALGSFLFDLGDLAGAERAFARAIELAPDFPEPSYLLAKVHQIRGQDELAEARMAALRAVASDHPATHTLVGRFEAERGRFDAAEAYLGRGPTELGFTRMVRAQVALQRGDGEQAARLMDGVGARLAAGPPRARLHFLALRGDLDGVLETLAGHWRQGLRGEVTDPPDVGIYFIDHADFLAEMRHDPRFQSLLAEIRAPLDSLRTLVPALPF